VEVRVDGVAHGRRAVEVELARDPQRAAGPTSAAARHPVRPMHSSSGKSYLAVTGEWIEAHAYPSEAGLSIYYRDVSDRHRAEEAL
jgi:hypothetical protein